MSNSQSSSIKSGQFLVTIISFLTLALAAPAALALSVDELVGSWSMSYNMGQGNQTGTITIARNADGSAAITLNTQGGGTSEASDVAIAGDELTFSRTISAQGQSIPVNYKASLVDGQLQGTFELDLGGFDAGGPVQWSATRE